jgi:4-amino-4-deoxy-L-arabinose transferase-like glycosyltransferase
MLNKLTPPRIALALLGLALLRSLILALVIQPSYGADGLGYLRYIDTFIDPSDRESLWYIRGTTPVYPGFAYAAYLFGWGSGYTIVLAQVILGGLVAPFLYLALRPIQAQTALLSGILIAIDPQTGLLFQHIATEALYITLLGWGMAAFFWAIQRELSWKLALGLGLLLGIGSLTRPVGLLLIVPYAFFHLLMTRSVKRTVALAMGYGVVIVALSFINLWRFDFFATSNTNGLYLGTRIFGTGGLYDRTQGEYSEKLFRLAVEPVPYCEIHLTDNPDPDLAMPQYLRLCLYYGHGMTLDEISRLYQGVYGESLRARPERFIRSTAAQLGEYLWTSSDPYDLEGAQAQVTLCDKPATSDAWYEDQQMFCPGTPTPLKSLEGMVFTGMLGFSLVTRAVNFLLAGILFFRSRRLVRWVFLFCLGMYTYHAVITAVAGTILGRYITVTNPYLLVTFAFVITGFGEWYRVNKSNIGIISSVQ